MENPDHNPEDDIFFRERQILADNLEQRSMRYTGSALKFAIAGIWTAALSTKAPETLRDTAYAVTAACAISVGMRAVQAVAAFKDARAINPKLPN